MCVCEQARIFGPFLRSAFLTKKKRSLWENYSLWFCPFALLPFCPIVLLPFCPFALMSLPLPPPWLSCKFWRLSENTFFVFVFTFQFMCRYCWLSWCYSCLHRWQLRPSSFGEKLRLCPFWLQILKLYLNIWRLGGGQGVGAGYHGILEYELPTPNVACFVSKEPNAVLA